MHDHVRNAVHQDRYSMRVETAESSNSGLSFCGVTYEGTRSAFTAGITAAWYIKDFAVLAETRGISHPACTQQQHHLASRSAVLQSYFCVLHCTVVVRESMVAAVHGCIHECCQSVPHI